MTRLVALQRPEAGGIRGEHLIAQHHVAVLIQTKLELGVGDDDATGQGVLSALLVQGDGVVPQLGGVLFAVAGELLFQHLNAALVGDVLVVVADLGLGGGGNHDQAVAIVVNFTDFAFFDGLECSHSQTLHFPFSGRRARHILTALLYHAGCRFERNRWERFAPRFANFS